MRYLFHDILQSVGQLEHNMPQFTVDVQLGPDSNALVIFVVGRLTINGENPLHFTQVFQLVSILWYNVLLEICAHMSYRLQRVQDNTTYTMKSCDWCTGN